MPDSSSQWASRRLVRGEPMTFRTKSRTGLTLKGNAHYGEKSIDSSSTTCSQSHFFAGDRKSGAQRRATKL